MSNFLSTLLGLGSIAAPFIPGGAAFAPALGAGASLLAGHDASHAQNRAMAGQQAITRGQAGLFNQAAPQYQDLLHLASQYANTGELPNAYSLQQLNNGYLRQANEHIGQNTQQAQHNLSYALGRRGLANSNLDVAGRAAILADANRQRSGFEQQLSLNLPNMFEHRLGMLSNILNLGLGQGAIAGGTFGQQAGMYGQQAAGAGQNLGSIMQQMAYLQALKQSQGAGTHPVQDYSTLPGPRAIPGISVPTPGQGQGNPFGFSYEDFTP